MARKKLTAAPDDEIVAAGVFTQEEIDVLRAKAKKQIDDQIKKQKEEALLAQFVEEAKRAHDPSEEIVSVQIDVPGFAKDIRIDGVVYQQGEIREFTVKQAASIRDIMGNMWKHESTVGQANASQYRPVSNHGAGNTTIGPNTVVNTRHFARV